MATLEQRGNRFRVIFRFEGKRYAAALEGDDREAAGILVAEVEVVLRKLKKGLLALPAGADVVRFVLSGGQTAIPVNPPAAAATTSAGPGIVDGSDPATALTLGQLRDRYVRTLGNGAVEANTLRTIRIHFGHWVATLGADFPIGTLTRQHLQAHVDRRAAGVGRRGRRCPPRRSRRSWPPCGPAGTGPSPTW